MAKLKVPGCARRRVTTALFVLAAELLFPASLVPASLVPASAGAAAAPIGAARIGAGPGALAPSSPECVANRAAGTVHFASPFGYDASAGIIDVYAAGKLGYFADLCLDVDFVATGSTQSIGARPANPGRTGTASHSA